MKNLLTTLVLALLLGVWNAPPAKADFIPGLIFGYLLFSGDDKDKETSEEKLERLRKEALEEQAGTGDPGHTHTINVFEFVKDSEERDVFFMKTRSLVAFRTRAVRFKCIDNNPQVAFFLGDPDYPFPFNPESPMRFWTSHGNQERHWWKETGSVHPAETFYSPILTGEPARQASQDLLQPNSTFGHDHGLKVRIDQDEDHDFDETLDRLSCFQTI